MSMKDKMIQEFQNTKVVKTSDQITGDIRFWMENGRRELFHDAKVISDSIIQEFQDKGFTVEQYEDEHSKAQGIELIKFSW